MVEFSTPNPAKELRIGSGVRNLSGSVWILLIRSKQLCTEYSMVAPNLAPALYPLAQWQACINNIYVTHSHVNGSVDQSDNAEMITFIPTIISSITIATMITMIMIIMMMMVVMVTMTT